MEGICRAGAISVFGLVRAGHDQGAVHCQDTLDLLEKSERLINVLDRLEANDKVDAVIFDRNVQA